MILWASSLPSSKNKSIDIRYTAKEPWNRLSPDYQQGQIPIPGLAGMYADCITGMMEGLKLIGPTGKPGKINPGYFQGPGRERPVEAKEWILGYSFAGQRVSLGEARQQIMIPAYHWVLWNRCHDLVANLREMGKQQDVWVYDGVGSGYLHDPDPFSMACALVSFLNRSPEVTKPLVLQ